MSVLYRFLLLVALAGIQRANAQSPTAPSALPVRVPPSPTAAALERYAMMPVNEASGIPSISVPLAEVRSGQLSLSLTASYHAGGIRVNDVASWLGLGWSLNAGGAVTRVVRGLPDEFPNGFGNTYGQVLNADSLSLFSGSQNVPTADYYKVERVVNRQLDTEPDLYYYNFQGKTGSFMLGNESPRRFHTLPMAPLQITFSDSSITIRDEHGAQYWFADREYSRSVQGRRMDRHITAWNLTRIVSADRADTIRFLYDTYSTFLPGRQQQLSLVSSVELLADGGDGGIANTIVPSYDFQDIFSRTSLTVRRLRQIVCAGMRVDLSMAADRVEGMGEKRLRALHVLSRDGVDTLRRVRFFHSYFNGDLRGYTDEQEWLRLRLDSIGVQAPGQLRLPPYAFRYNTVSLPHRLMGSRDTWGYANGRQLYPGGGFALLPRTLITSYAERGPAWFGAADYRVDSAFVQAGMLVDITYPTGGRHTFKYEPNTIAQRYRIPNPRTTIRVDTAGIDTNDQARIATTRFHVTGTVDSIRCHVAIGFGSWAAGYTGPTHRALGRVELYDITGGQRHLLHTWEQSRGNSIVDTSEATFYLNDQIDYELKVTCQGPYSAAIELSYESANHTYGWRNVLVGGVRLREQRTQAARNAPVTRKRYYYTTPGTTLSSGYLINQARPLYTRNHITRLKSEGGGGGCVSNGSVVCPQPSLIQLRMTVLSSTSLGELEGSEQIVGYQAVTVVDTANTGETAGRTVSWYSAATESGSNEPPYLPKVLTGWQRGLLLRQRLYAYSASGQWALVKQVVNTYATKDTVWVKGFHAVSDAIFLANTQLTTTPGVQPFAYGNYRQPCGWTYLAQARSYQYAPTDTTRALVQTTTYRYHNLRHQQPTVVETAAADGRREQTRYRYAADCDTAAVGTAGALAVRTLLRQHALARPIEQLTVRLTPRDSVVTAGTCWELQQLPSGAVVPAIQQRLALAAPKPLSAFTVAAVRNGAFSADPAYQAEYVFDRYDVKSRIAEYHRPKGARTSCAWDEATGQPLLVADGASVGQVAYTSFEPRALGGWSYDVASCVNGGRSGQQAYQLTNASALAHTLAGTSPHGYDLTAWVQSGVPVIKVNSVPVNSVPRTLLTTSGGWQLLSWHVAAADNQVLSVTAPMGTSLLIDEVRLAPTRARITSFTYDPLRGMSSQTDPSGRTSYYEYDALGRLLRVRDEQGRILTEQEYKYGRQF